MENQTKEQELEELRKLLKSNGWECDGPDENGFDFWKDGSENLFTLDAK